VRDEIKSLLSEKLSANGITVKEVNIVNFNFSQSFNEAIEAKVTAEQNALAAKNKLEQVKFEASQAIAEAEGKAKALQIEGQALSSNPQVKELRAIEKWNGILPQVTGDSVPFINIR
jgi:regulator of protease activity HflC (stomatin/prohibitin superfamily)